MTTPHAHRLASISETNAAGISAERTAKAVKAAGGKRLTYHQSREAANA
jgi:hypothetical protein